MVLLLIVLLAAVFLHVAMEGAEAAAELGDLCIAFAAVLGPVLLFRLVLAVLPELAVESVERGPPRAAKPIRDDWTSSFSVPLAIPLRR